MGQRALPGTYVKSLFKVLRLLGVPQLAVAQHLRVPPSAVSMWATGTRPIPQRHYDSFRGLVWSKIRYVQDRCGERHAAWSPPQPEAVSPSTRHAVPDRTRPAAEGGRAEAFAEPLWSMPEYAVLEQIVPLVQEWERELRQEDLDHEIWEQCRVLGRYGEQDFETFARGLRSPGRAALARAFETGWTALRSLDELSPNSDATRLSQYLAQCLKAFNMSTTVGTGQAEDRALETRPRPFRDQWPSSLQPDFGAIPAQAGQLIQTSRLISFTDEE
jgi:hypothetical protein